MKYNLSEVVELIKDRRSIRPELYSDRKVHKEIVASVLNSAIWAPTHGMNQPWRFKVFMGDGLKRLGEVLPGMYRDLTPSAKYKPEKEEKLRKRCEQVSVITALVVQKDLSGRIPVQEEVAAMGCAVQNMMLHCTAYGLGSFWSSPKFVYSSEMAEFLDLEEGQQCVGLFYMGYPNADWPTSHRRPIEYVTEWIES